MKKITLLCVTPMLMFFGQVYSQTPPANDNLANAVVLTMGASCTNDFFTNTDATVEANEPIGTCFTGATHTVWFSFTAPASGAVQISTDILPGNIGDTQIALYPSPTNPNDLSTLPGEVGCDQDGGTQVSNGTSTYMSVLETGGLVAGNTYYIQVDGWSGATGDFCIQVEEVTCPNPSNLEANNIMSFSAELDWVENGIATLWDIELGLAGFAPTGTPTYDDITKPYTVTGLTLLTDYEFYVRSDCGGGDVSEWIGPFGFSTVVCQPQNQCDYIFRISDSFGDGWNGNMMEVRQAGIVLATLDLPTGTGPVDVLVPVCEGLPVELAWTVTGSFTNEVIIEVIDGLGNTAYSMPSGSGSLAGSTLFSGTGMCTPPTCPQPTALAANNITTTTADLSWNEAGTATLWDIAILPTGSLPSTPTASGLTTTSYTATGLTQATGYGFYVRSDCGNGDVSFWAGPFGFITTCPPANTCDYTFRMTDSFGDGWNGNVMEVKQNGAVVATLELTTFGPTSGTGPEDVLVSFCDGIPIELVWSTVGSFTSEVGVEVIDAFGATVFTMPFNSGSLAGTSLYSDVAICTPPTCPRPTALTATNIMATSADLGWAPGGTETLWDVEVVLAGIPPTGTPTATGVGNPYNVTGLTAGTSYEFYVRADCGAGDLSFFAGPFAFMTPCLPIGPFTENFGGVPIDEIPDCWSKIISSTSTDPFVEVRGFNSFSPPNNLALGNLFDASAEVYAITPALVDLPLGTHQMRFQAQMGTGATLLMGTMANPNDETTFTLVQTLTTATPFTYDEYIVPFNITTTDTYIAFKGTYSATFNTINLDDIVWEPIPTCPRPNLLTATNITTTAADLGWTEVGTATQWDVEIVPAGTTPTGTPTASGVSNPYNATGLSPSSTFEFYVRADCGGGDLSNWTGPFSFSTLCAPVSIYSENFDGIPINQLPICWNNIISSTSTNPFVEVQGFNSFSAPNNLTFGSGFTSSADVYGIPPELADLPAGTHQMRFHAQGDVGATLELGTMSDPTDETTYTTVQTVTLTDNYQEFIVPFSGTTADTYVAFKAVFTANFDRVNVDDLFWEPIPSCPKPNTLTATGIGPYTAVLGWTDNAGASLWDVEIVLAGNPPTGTPTASGVSNPYNATGLNAATDYEFYVRADCGGGDVSIYEGPLAFTTACGVVFAPISEDFASNTTPLCWTEGGLTSWTYSLGADFAASMVGDHTPGGGTNYAWMDGSDNEDGEASTLTTYPVNLSGLSHPAIEFYLFSNNLNDAAANIVEVEVFDGLNFYKVFTLTKVLGTDWERFVIDLDNYSFAGPIQVIFTVTGENNKTGDTQHNDILLDDLSFIESPCPAPTSVTISNIGFTGADVTWTPGGTETEWRVEYGPAGFIPGTGTVVIDNDGNPLTSLTGLDPGTDYDVYVTAICTPDIDSQSLPATFTTDLDCPPITGFAVVAGATSIDLAWTPGGTETGWIIEFGPAGFTPGTGTIVVDNDGTPGEFIIGLTPDTDYDVYVTPICGGKNGDLFGPTTLHTPNLGIDEAAFEGFSFFPNPVKNRLFIKATGVMEKVAIYNLLGQRVLEIRPESLTSELDLSGLQTGTYVMEVMINGSRAVFKLIKE